jgi:DNA-binding CsgD family transcriptional regulator
MPLPRRDTFARLSPRERDVLARLNAGRTVKEAADDLGITYKTCSNHCENMRIKLDLHGCLALHDFARSFKCALMLTDTPRR